jgi:hypothetical protein
MFDYYFAKRLFLLCVYFGTQFTFYIVIYSFGIIIYMLISTFSEMIP